MYFSIVLMLATKNNVSFDQRLFIYYQIDSVPDFIISKPEKKIVQCNLPIHDLLIHDPRRFTVSYLFLENF